MDWYFKFQPLRFLTKFLYVARVACKPLKPWKTLKNPGFSLPLEKYPEESRNYNPPLTNYVLKQISHVQIFGHAVLLHFLILGRMSLPLLTGMDSDNAIGGHTGGYRGCETPSAFISFSKSCNVFVTFGRICNAFLPLGKFCNTLYNLINSAIFCTIR